MAALFCLSDYYDSEEEKRLFCVDGCCCRIETSIDDGASRDDDGTNPKQPPLRRSQSHKSKSTKQIGPRDPADKPAHHQVPKQVSSIHPPSAALTILVLSLICRSSSFFLPTKRTNFSLSKCLSVVIATSLSILSNYAGRDGSVP